jgi:hypothetical protein
MRLGATGQIPPTFLERNQSKPKGVERSGPSCSVPQKYHHSSPHRTFYFYLFLLSRILKSCLFSKKPQPMQSKTYWQRNQNVEKTLMHLLLEARMPLTRWLKAVLPNLLLASTDAVHCLRRPCQVKVLKYSKSSKTTSSSQPSEWQAGWWWGGSSKKCDYRQMVPFS